MTSYMIVPNANILFLRLLNSNSSKMSICRFQNIEICLVAVFELVVDGRWLEGYPGDSSGAREATVSAVDAKYELGCLFC